MVFVIDNNLGNSDWIKRARWDLPFTTFEQFVTREDLTGMAHHVIEMAVRKFIKLPAYLAAPESLVTGFADFLSGKVMKEWDADLHPRDLATGKFGDNASVWPKDKGAGKIFPRAENDAAFKQLSAAESKWYPLNHTAVWTQDPATGKDIVDREKTPTETLAAYDEWLKASGDCWGNAMTLEPTGREYGIADEFRREMFSTTDSEGNPTNPGTDKMGAGEDLWKLRDLYVVPDDATLRMNASIRAGRASTRADKIDAWVNSSTLQKDLVVYRGAAMTQEQSDLLQPGFTYNDKGFQSAGYTPREARSYLDSRIADGKGDVPVMMRYSVAAGTHAADAAYDEVVVQRNTQNTIIGRNETNGTVYLTVGVTNGK